MTRDAMLFLPAKILEGILILACASLYSYLFSKSTVGSFNYVNTSVQMIYLVLNGWMMNACSRFATEETAKDKGQTLFSTISTIYVLICAGSLAVCGVLYAVSKDSLYLGFAAFLCSFGIFQILNAALVQLGKIKASIFLSLGSATLKLVLAVALVWGLHVPESPFIPIFINVFAEAFAGIGAIFVLSLPKLVRLKYFSVPMVKKLFSFGLPLVSVSISISLLNRIDVFFIRAFFPEDMLAVYSSNNSLVAGLFSMISAGIMRGVYPAVLRAWQKEGKEAVIPLIGSGVRLYLLVAVPAVCGVSAVSYLMSYIFFDVSKGYTAGAPVIAYSAIALLFMALTEYANKAYELEKKTVYIFQNSFIALIVKIISSLILLKLVGFTGGAIGSIIAFITYFAVTCLRVRKFFLFKLPEKSLVRICFSGVLCGLSAFAVTKLPISPVPKLALAVVVGAVVYSICIIASGEGKEEFKYIRSKLAR